MKKVLFLLVILCLSSNLAFSQTKAPVPDIPGMILEYVTVADGSESVTRTEVLSVNTKGEQKHVRVRQDIGDAVKDQDSQEMKEMIDSLSIQHFVIEGGLWYMDLKNYLENTMISTIAAQAGDDKETIDMLRKSIKITGDNMKYPILMKPGQQVQPQKLGMSIKISIFSISMDFVNSRYECTGTETVTVPAGTFDTYIIESDIEVSSKAFGMNKKEKTSTRTWYSPGIGAVKLQTYSSKGKLISEQYLKSITEQE